MTALQEQYVTDRECNRVGVLLGLEQFEEMLEALEELDDIRAYDEAKASEEEFIPFEQAVAEIRLAHLLERGTVTSHEKVPHLGF